MADGDVTSEGTRLIKRWFGAVECLSQARSNTISCECEVANSANELGKWLLPPDAKPGEKIAVWFGDSFIQAEVTAGDPIITCAQAWPRSLMVAYSFKPRFVEPIRRGLEPGPWLRGMKRQTIRADRKRHARPGEEVQLYRGMRTKQCFLIGKALCIGIYRINIHFRARHRSWLRNSLDGKIDRRDGLDRFARRDGFADWEELATFWRDEHAGIDDFSGLLIVWEPIDAAAPW